MSIVATPTDRNAEEKLVLRRLERRALCRAATAVLAAALLAGIPMGAEASVLSDGRAYELVSPPDKNGGDVMGDSARTRASAAGDALAFTSLAAFGDARGTGTAVEYMSERESAPGTNGWSTHAITPPQQPLNTFGLIFGVDPLWQGELSEDLSRGVFSAWSPVTNDANTARVQNLYVRNDLRTGGPGAYEELTSCAACSSPLQIANGQYAYYQPVFAGASGDFSHILFESVFNLTADAPALDPSCATGERPDLCQPRLYEWADGTVRFVGILPDGTAAAATVAARPGPPARDAYISHAISYEGRRIFFIASPTSCGAASCGSLYMRTDSGSPNATTVLINASERTDCADQNPCTGAPEPDPNGARPATFWTASRSGSRVFFTTVEALTDDAPVNANRKLYMYDADKGDGDPHNLTLLSGDREPADGSNGVDGVIGASEDGSAVYFIASGQLVAGKPITGNPNIFEWRDGVETYVGELAAPGTDELQDLASGSWPLFNNRMQARVTPDGRHLLFVSHSGEGLGGYDHGNSCTANMDLTAGSGPCGELYVYTEGAPAPVCASCNPNGAAATSDATTTVRVGTGGAVTSSHLPHAISDDGRFVFFSTREALVPEDVNGKVDAYEYDTTTGRVHLISSGTDAADSYFMDASADGQNVFFLTRQRLVGWDQDQNYDVYDARVGGGFPEPSVAPVCLGDSCQGPQSTAPNSTGAASASLHSAGNVVTPKAKKPSRCKRGFVHKRIKGRVRCVRKHSKHVVAKHHAVKAGRSGR